MTDLSLNRTSPILSRFEQNAIFNLTVEPGSTLADGVVAAGRAMTLARAELPNPEQISIPWLRRADLYEMQRLLQTVEEPLPRLVEQLFWFDFQNDAEANVVKAALKEPSVSLPPFYELSKSHEGISAQERISAVARAINRCNVNLLLAAGMTSGAVVSSRRPDLLARIEWSSDRGGVSEVTNAHILAICPAEKPIPWASILEEWGRLTEHSWFREYVIWSIECLQDEYLLPDEADTVIEAFRTQLTELYSHEARAILADGDPLEAKELIDALAAVKVERRALAACIRPLNSFFRAQLELHEQTFGAEFDDFDRVDVYLTGLEYRKETWEQLDSAGLLGLSNLLDEAADRIGSRVRRGKLPVEEKTKLVDRIKRMANADSLLERLKAFEKDLNNEEEWVCFFCKENDPEEDYNVVIEGKKILSVTRSGNTTTTRYQLYYRLVPRCGRCFRLHDFVANAGNALILVVGVALLVTIVPNVYPYFEKEFLTSLWILVFVGWIPFVVLIGIPYLIFDAIMTRMVTPKDHVRKGNDDGAHARQELKKLGCTQFSSRYGEKEWTRIKT